MLRGWIGHRVLVTGGATARRSTAPGWAEGTRWTRRAGVEHVVRQPSVQGPRAPRHVGRAVASLVREAWSRIADAWSSKPPLLGAGRMVNAVKVATAACGAWLLVLPFGGIADTYPYYAPLGAVVAFADTVAGSARRVASTVGAIALGAGLAVLGQAVPVPRDLGLVAVVLVGS